MITLHRYQDIGNPEYVDIYGITVREVSIKYREEYHYMSYYESSPEYKNLMDEICHHVSETFGGMLIFRTKEDRDAVASLIMLLAPNVIEID